MQFSGDLLILEEDPVTRQTLETIFNFLGVNCQSGELADCLSYLESALQNVDICVIGKIPATLKIPELMQNHPATAFICCREDGEDYSSWPNFMGRMSKTPDYDNLISLLHYCQSFRTMRRYEKKNAQKNATSRSLIKMLIGQTPSIVHVRSLIEQVAPTEASVLILGESGTGKEVVARAIHALSKRSRRPFVPVNCGAIPGELLESELFGHEKGAFTGAISSHEGRFELAEGGTLFLDEIGDMPLQMQVKLLRVLQERKFERVGSNKMLNADVRIIAATHQNLEKMVEEHNFREDLYYRLNVFPIETPPLRKRVDDIPLLVQELVNRLGREHNIGIRFTQRAMLTLMQNEWKGNVRELSNLVERMLILHPDEVVDNRDLPPKYRGEKLATDACAERDALLDYFAPEDTPDEIEDNFDTFYNTEKGSSLPSLPVIEDEEDIAKAFHPTLDPKGINLKDMVADIEISMIKQALTQCGGVVAKASEVLGLRRTTLVEKMKKYGISAQG